MAAWWTTRVAIPVALLVAASAAIRRSQIDRESLEPFFDRASNGFPLRHAWIVDDVLHDGVQNLVVVVTGMLLLGAVVGWRLPSWKDSARRATYLAACVLVTVMMAQLWKHVAHQISPWDTLEFGGRHPWPEPDGLIDSPGAHAASGFAWCSLYFVGATLNTRRRWAWLVPGLVLGGLFALLQHVRGAHAPSHEPLSAALAWGVAAILAMLFRRLGWLKWSEREDPDPHART